MKSVSINFQFQIVNFRRAFSKQVGNTSYLTFLDKGEIGRYEVCSKLTEMEIGEQVWTFDLIF